MTRMLPGLVILAALLGGCAGQTAFKAGEKLARQGRYDLAFHRFAEAASANPERSSYRMRLQDVRPKAALMHLETGRVLLQQGDSAGALNEFGQAAALDPTNQTAALEIKRLEAEIRAQDLAAQAEQRMGEGKYAQAKSLLEEAVKLSPEQAKARELLTRVQEREHRTIIDGMELDVASDKPITLKFKDADIRDVFTILTKLSGINFIFDEDIKAQRVTILLEQGTFAQALQLLLGMNNLEKKILNAKTIIIYPNTKEKDKKFEDHLIQTFYLSNIDAKKAVNLLRTMLQLRKIYVHEELNALVIRDTPATVRLAQQILDAADRSDSEVVYELELVEVTHSNNVNLGVRLSPYSTSFGYVNPGTDKIESPVVSGLSDLKFLYTIPTGSFTFQKNLNDSELLANPKIRVKNREKAKVHIGSREPIVTNTLTAQGDVTSTNVQYVDVGIKLDVEPNIQLDNTVVTKINLEVSDGQRQTFGETQALAITTTNAQTSLILRDGEQTIIGGLIRNLAEKRKATIPIIGDIPFLGNLISGHERNKTKREILLSITPHVVKKVEVPGSEVATIWSGGEDDLQSGARYGAFASILEPEVKQEPPPPAPATGSRSRRAPPRPVVQAPESGPDVETDAHEAESPPPAAGRTVPPPVQASPVLSPVEPQILLAGPAEIAAGEEAVFDVRAIDMRNLYSAPLFVKFDMDRLEFVRAEEGSFLRSGGHGTLFSTAGDGSRGELIVGHKQNDGSEGVSGEGVLFRLVFRGRTPGAARLALEKINFRDPTGARINVGDSETLVNVR